MHEENIRKIMKSSLWKKINRNKNYHDYKIVKTHGDSSGFQMLIVFFDMNIKETTMMKYLKEGKRIATGEYLDNNKVLSTYGRVRMIVFS